MGFVAAVASPKNELRCNNSSGGTYVPKISSAEAMQGLRQIHSFYVYTPLFGIGVNFHVLFMPPMFDIEHNIHVSY